MASLRSEVKTVKEDAKKSKDDAWPLLEHANKKLQLRLKVREERILKYRSKLDAMSATNLELAMKNSELERKEAASAAGAQTLQMSNELLQRKLADKQLQVDRLENANADQLISLHRLARQLDSAAENGQARCRRMCRTAKQTIMP